MIKILVAFTTVCCLLTGCGDSPITADDVFDLYNNATDFKIFTYAFTNATGTLNGNTIRADGYNITVEIEFPNGKRLLRLLPPIGANEGPVTTIELKIPEGTQFRWRIQPFSTVHNLYFKLQPWFDWEQA